MQGKFSPPPIRPCSVLMQSCAQSPSRAAITDCCAGRETCGVAIWPLASACDAVHFTGAVIICLGTRGAKLAKPYAAHVTHSGGGSVQQGLSAAGGALGFYRLGVAANERWRCGARVRWNPKGTLASCWFWQVRWSSCHLLHAIAQEEIVLLTLYAKAKTGNITGAKLKEIRRALES